jgi:hypothetical protein
MQVKDGFGNFIKLREQTHSEQLKTLVHWLMALASQSGDVGRGHCQSLWDKSIFDELLISDNEALT